MGSLLPGWDESHGAPEGVQDFEEPSKLPRSPRGAPSLGRISCPPALHTSPSGTSSLRGSSGSSQSLAAGRPQLGRASTSHPGSPRRSSSRPSHPGSPPAGGTALSRLLSVGREGEEAAEPLPSDVLHSKEQWCKRMDSASLNLRPDEGDPNAFRKGSFKPEDPLHSMHVHHPDDARAAAGEATPLP